MKVQGSPFYFGDEAASPLATFDKYIEWLKSESGEAGKTWPPHRKFARKEASHRRELFLNSSKEIVYGVVLSARTTDFEHHVKREGNTVKVEARNIGEDPPVEVNFFAIRTSSRKGLYSHYYGSYSFGKFMSDCHSSFRHWTEKQRDIALIPGMSRKEENKIKKEFSFYKKEPAQPMYSDETFRALVAGLKEVKEVRFTSYKFDGEDDEPVRFKLKGIHHTYRLEQTTPTQKILDWISKKREESKKIHSRNKIPNGSVRGFDNEDFERVIGFSSTLDDFLRFEYDNIGSFDTENLDRNPCIRKMKDVVSKYKVFE